MSAENFFISNPKGNNVDLEVTFISAQGNKKKLIIVHPGETAKIEKKEVGVRELPRPERLELNASGEYVKDTRTVVGSLKRVFVPPSEPA